jgi:nitroimidazol reductase NimA-like FMN-containing flavoprotein (pyridoxamine 5'-phosphate oxidase superfamily)
MSQAIPDKYKDLFQKRAFASLGTLMPDGRPQVTPVWCDYDGEHVIFNSAKGRQKDRNVRRDPKIPTAISRSAAASSRSPKRAPTRASTSSRRNISASTNIPMASRAKCA